MKILIRRLVKQLFLISVLLVIAQFSYAQNWKSATNTTYLKNLSEELDRIYKEYRKSVEIFALEREILLREVLDNGTTVSLIRIMPSGIPEYYKSDNLKASENVGTDKLRPEADL